ncbi:MAG: choice-of-anchor J domain-containing protein, partial [Wenzhouxiangella sp.]
GPISSNFGEGFGDITELPGAGWSLQNLSDPLGTSNWFQGNPEVFAAHEGEPDSYIGANFNNTAGGTGIISNWLMTPEVQLLNGTELRFWTRTVGNQFPDRLEVRLSSSGSSTFAGSAATDVGDFDTLLLSINENLGSNYPEVWTEFVVEVSGLAEATSGRFAFRYFVTDAGPLGANSNFIGIDTVSVAQPNSCENPSDVPWLSVSPFFGATDAGDSSVVNVAVDTTGLAAGSHDAFICVSSNDTEADLIQVPFNIQVLGDEVFRDRFEG